MNRWRGRLRLWLLVLPMAAVIGFVSAGPAAAHTSLVDTTPGESARIAAVPEAISLTFSQSVLKLGAAVKVTGPDGLASTGKVKVTGKKVSWSLPADLPNGTYTVAWRVTSNDGHPIDGTFEFVLRAPVTAATSTPAAVTPTPVNTPHTADPEMTGAMPGMEGMPGMQEAPPSEEARSSLPAGLAIAGLVLLMLLVAGAIAIERWRRPQPGANPSGPPIG